MPDGNGRLPDKKEEQDSLLTKASRLAPLVAVVLQILDLVLKIFGMIQ